MALLLFNWYGYQFVINYFNIKADKELNVQLDNNQYIESELIELRIPLNLPYQNNSEDYERVYGEINYGGTIFSFVKRKVEDGYLILKCIPNRQKENIQKKSREITKYNNGIDQDQKSSSSSGKSIKSSITDFLKHNLAISILSVKSEPANNSISVIASTCIGFKSPLKHPPDLKFS